MINQSPPTIRTRMAPSPTGEMHVGSLATLLKNYAFAKKHHGQFILRIEDTDKAREVPGGVEAIMKIIRAYGLDWDEGPDKPSSSGPFIQSERLQLYQQHAEQLLKERKAYRCFCSKDRLEKLREAQTQNHQPSGYDQHCLKLSEEEINQNLADQKPFVIRLHVPENQTIEFTDVLRGKITFNSSDIDDQVLIKSDGYPTYHLGVVVDDHLMNITHIIRGEEWISSAPKHVILYQVFGWELPVFCHVPVFLNPDGRGKMSKRKGTVSAQSFLDRGYLPQAMLNFLMILGWTPQDQRDLVSLEEYIQEFDLADLHPNSVVFDLQKLDWLNGQYIRQLSDHELLTQLKPFLPSGLSLELLAKILPLIKERLVRLDQIAEFTDFFYKQITVTKEILCPKDNSEECVGQLSTVLDQLATLTDWSTTNLESSIRQTQSDHAWSKSHFFMLLRLAVTGKKATPPLFETMAVMGKELVLARLQVALTTLST